MEYVMAIDGASSFGSFLLLMNGKIGGASSAVMTNVTTHPLILCRDLDWSSAPGFVLATHLQNPGTGDQAPRSIAIRVQDVLFAHEHQPATARAPVAQDQPQKLH